MSRLKPNIKLCPKCENKEAIKRIGRFGYCKNCQERLYDYKNCFKKKLKGGLKNEK